MSFDSTNASACITTLQSLGCGAHSRPTICDGVLKGLITQTYTGLGGAAPPCNMAREFGLARVGAVGMLPPDQALFSECGSGLFCSNTIPLQAQGSICTGFCLAYAGVGASCTNTPCSGTSCTSMNIPCAPGLTCSQTGQCVATPAAQACTTTGDCGTGSYCATGSACEPLGNQACVAPLQPNMCCAPGPNTCGSSGYCASDASCHLLPLLGQACSLGKGTTAGTAGYEALCVSGECDTTTGRCVQAVPGASCTLNAALANAACGPNALCGSTFKCSAACF